MIAHVTGTLIKGGGLELVLWCGDTSVLYMHIWIMHFQFSFLGRFAIALQDIPQVPKLAGY